MEFKGKKKYRMSINMKPLFRMLSIDRIFNDGDGRIGGMVVRSDDQIETQASISVSSLEDLTRSLL